VIVSQIQAHKIKQIFTKKNLSQFYVKAKILKKNRCTVAEICPFIHKHPQTRDVLLSQHLLSAIRNISESEWFTFQQDNASAHRARETVEFLSRNTPDSIAPSLWPPNSPDLNPVDYQVWSALQQRIDSQRGTVEKNSDQRVAPFPTANQCHQAMACSIEGVCS